MFYHIEDIPDSHAMQAVVARLLPLVPFQRRDKALRYKHLHGQYCCLRTWEMLYELLVSHDYLPAKLRLQELTYEEDEHGKPWLTIDGRRSAEIFFSVSHTKNAVAVVISRLPVGIDVEAVVSHERVGDRAFLERTMSASECRRIAEADNPRIAFTELWTRKEAYVKLQGTGLDMRTLPMLLDCADACTFHTGHTDEYAYSVAYVPEHLEKETKRDKC